ncbi:BlaI/MecI/CopY family transcriptional regulator [Pseudoflavonifractor phocaeensis]|uniref:BlaI/MecI/CopY family transcriptional regulator n=1 Tax=Pseudoflavonifractor phocaeensis TaxID=1870988 RepID=UPI00195A0561|nr:BlaI/MecI/CopY family transcriptional regulator [Pseudoflavonifractor phocaeensis]MBM6937033.1 BlaI/MecI/CopY family transcriptional regulator [Pseudoflavonifractor phocaeensis]
MKEKQRLPESELDLMLAVWGLGEGATAPAILERLERPLTASALHSYLKRLEEKGFLRCEKVGKVNRYTPLVSRAAYERQESRSILGKLYQGSLKRFAASLYDGGGLDRNEVAELRAYLEELERKEGE